MLAALALGSCKGGHREAASQTSEPPVAKPAAAPESRPAGSLDGPLVRLAEWLAQAEIDSPLRDADPAVLDVGTEVVFDQGFERFTERLDRPSVTGGCRAALKPEGTRSERVLVYRDKANEQCYFVIPAAPSTYYRVRRTIRTGDDSVDLRVIESRVALRHPTVLNHPDDVARIMGRRFVRMRGLLYIHSFPRPAAKERWETHSLELLSTPYTRSLVLMIHDAESVAGGRLDGEAWIDDLLVERLSPSREELLALLKADLAAEGADLSLGMYKHGQFLPIGSLAQIAPPHDANYDYRYGILAVAPTSITYRLDPQGRRLRLSAGLLKGSRPGDSVTFSVLARREAGTRRLWEKTLTVGETSKAWHWHEARLDLADLGAGEVDLVLQTRAPEGSRGMAIWGNPIVERPRRQEDPPNVIVLGLDTLRADRLSAYGYGRSTSPHLQALAADGVRFAQAASSSNWTTPSFASIFTGLSPSQHQVIHRARAIAPGLTTLAELFQRAGWATGAVAYKAYLYNMGFEQGFDSWFNVPRYDVRADDNLDKALAWLDDNDDRRFFLFLHFNDPHQPFNQPAPFDRRFNDPASLSRLGLKLPIVIEPSGGIQGCSRCDPRSRPFRELARDLYDGAVAYMDDRIGKFLEALKARNLYDDTIIAVVADHGELMWEHGDYFGHGGPYLYDELTRVPLIIKPSRRHDGPPVRPGTVVEAQVRAFDLMPTLLEMVGIEPPASIPAESLTSMWSHPAPAPRVAVSENVKQHVLSVRDGSFKLVLSNPPGRPVRERLFDMIRDPGEKNDVAAMHPDVVARLHEHAARYWLQARRGHYVLVLGAGAHDYQITVQAGGPLRSAHPLLGVANLGSSDGGRSLRFGGREQSPVVLLARFDGPPQADISVTVRSSDGTVLGERRAARFDVYDGRDLPAPAEGETRILLYRVDGHRPSTRLAITGERLEALMALGYIQ